MLRLPFMPQAFFSVLNPGKRVFFWRSEPQKKELSVSLKQEIIGLTLYSCGLGILLGTPLSWGVWTIFRYTLADTPEMILLFDIRAYLIPIIFTSFILIALLWILSGYMKRTDILSIIHQSHRAESPASDSTLVWAGFCAPVSGRNYSGIFYTDILCPCSSLVRSGVSYWPVLSACLCRSLYDAASHGCKRMAKRKNRYPHLISTGRMKFQGRQTVRNMLVITVLTAGAYFSAFYVPMLVTPARLSIASRPVDYSFFFRAGQNLPDRTRIEKLASKHQVTVTDYVSEPSATLAIDGYEEVETKGKVEITFTKK